MARDHDNATIIMRTDGSSEIGVGHLYRCLALAEALRGRGFEILFAVAVTPPPLVALLQQHGHAVHTLNASLHLDQLEALARRHHARAIGVDTYAADEIFFKQLAARRMRVFCIDDFAGFPLAAELVINHNIYAPDLSYQVSPRAHLLLGPRYALLRAQFRATRQRHAPHSTRANVIVLLGGSDPHNLTLKITRSLLENLPQEILLHAVVGPAASGLLELQQLARTHARLRVHNQPRNLPEIMSAATLAISGAGITVYELACLGVPALLLVIAENQRQNAEAFAHHGLAEVLGRHEQVSPESVAASALALLHDSTKLHNMKAAGQSLVDGLGAERVAEEIDNAFASH
ncbi:MAG: UDP-2,4-diacetamido-2,4,6-trideoxy-beta-L-altropyranose hydrolase [candidate division KSB1 bacterium]